MLAVNNLQHHFLCISPNIRVKGHTFTHARAREGHSTSISSEQKNSSTRFSIAAVFRQELHQVVIFKSTRTSIQLELQVVEIFNSTRASSHRELQLHLQVVGIFNSAISNRPDLQSYKFRELQFYVELQFT